VSDGIYTRAGGNPLRVWIRNYLIASGWKPSRGIPLDAATSKSDFHYDEERPVKHALATVRDNTMISFERAVTLWQQIRYLDRYRIQGAVVECGVWKGGAVGLMALAHMKSAVAPERHLHLFDSFEGLPEPDAGVDGDEAVRFTNGKAAGRLQTTKLLAISVEDSRSLLEKKIGYPRELIHFHKGWFQDTVARDADEIGDIALLRLDGDWYDSTAVCLEHLYRKVVRYGVVVIDDYGHFEGCRRAVDEFMAAESAPILLNHVDYTGRYFIKVA
jgi:hypothetical protein